MYNWNILCIGSFFYILLRTLSSEVSEHSLLYINIKTVSLETWVFCHAVNITCKRSVWYLGLSHIQLAYTVGIYTVGINAICLASQWRSPLEEVFVMLIDDVELFWTPDLLCTSDNWAQESLCNTTFYPVYRHGSTPHSGTCQWKL